MFKGKDIAITSLETITAFDMAGKYLFTLDELQNASIEQTQDSQEITGKGGRKLATLKRNKGVTVSGANGLVSGGLLEMQTGNTFSESGDVKYLYNDYNVKYDATESGYFTEFEGVKLNDSDALVPVQLYAIGDDGAITTVYTQVADASQAAATIKNPFSYDASSKKLTFKDAPGANMKFVAHYYRSDTGYTLTNLSDKYSSTAALYIDALGEDTCSNQYHIQFYIPRADFSGEFTFEMGDDQTVHNFEAEALAGGACGGEKGAFWTYTVFGVDEASA